MDHSEFTEEFTAPQLLSSAASPEFCLDLDVYAHLHICQIGCPPDTCEVLTGTCLGTSSCDQDFIVFAQHELPLLSKS